MELLYQMSYNVTYCDVLPLLLNKVLLYPIQHTTYLWPGGATQWCFATSVLCCHSPPTTHTAHKPLAATPRTLALPFTILIDKLVLM